MSIMAKIKSEVMRTPKGKPFSTKDFLMFGSRASVDQTFSRLVKMGTLSRLTRGVYVRPRYAPYVGEVLPDAIRVAEAIAVKSGYQIQLHGSEALRRLGLSTQVQTKPIFYTNGPNRKFHIGALEVSLQHVSPRKIALAGHPAGIALTALWYLGKKRVTTKTIAHIHSRLAPEEFQYLCAAVPSMPGWLHDVILDFQRNQKHD